MKVSISGNMEDAQLEGGIKIIEKILAVLREEWYFDMPEEFDNESMDFVSIAIFGCIMLSNPSKDELTALICSIEEVRSSTGYNISRSERIAEKLLVLKPRIDQNAEYTDDPGLQ